MQKLRILVLGGSRFVGRALVETARDRGHDVTAFNRGRHWPDDFADVELIRGDRRTDLGALAGRSWDVAIDTCGYHPSIAHRSAEALKGAVARYVFVSTISVYPWPIAPGTNEQSAVDILPADKSADGDDPQTYGIRKALCEAAVERAMPGRTLAIRPGMIVGPHDYTERFSYWVMRAALGGDILVPGTAERRMQLIDVADLVDFILTSALRADVGVVNATGPPYGALTWDAMLTACLAGTGGVGTLNYASDAFLTACGVKPGNDIPYWIHGDENGIFEVDLSKARALGLRTRPLADTVRRTYEWLRDTNYTLASTLSSGREAELLARAGPVVR